MIPYGRQEITQADIDAVVSVLESDFLTQGPMVPRFERAVSKHMGANNAVASNSATSALHIACLALGLGPGDWLWTSPITFVASANCGLYCGANVDFVDIDPRTYNLCPMALEEKLIQSEKEGKLPKVVVPVHLCGQSCDMEAIHKLSLKYGFKVIEDASHAIGVKYKVKYIGRCRYSDITIFSFHPVKIITTAEGGMALTNSDELTEKMTRFRSHGITNNFELMQSRPDNEIWNYQQIALGFNYRMTDVQAALGISQLERLDEYVERRHEIAMAYDESFADLPVVTPWQHPDCYSSYHLYPIRVRKSLCGRTQRQVYDELKASAIAVNLHYIPVYRQPYYEAFGFESGHCPEAECYHREALSLPMFPTLSRAQQKTTTNKISELVI